jgi:hypothetical protein
MSSIADQQLVLKNVQLQAQLDAKVEIISKNEELIAVYKKIETRADAAAVEQHQVYMDKKSEADKYMINCNKLETEVASLKQQMEVATQIALLTPLEKDYLVKFVTYAADRNIFTENDPLSDLFKGRKARKWSTLDTSTIKVIIEALASEDASKEKFNLVIYHKFTTKVKAQDEHRKAAAKRGPVFAHSSPNPKKSKEEEEDSGDSSK